MPNDGLISLSLHPLLAEALRRKGYDTLTAVQRAVAAPELAGRDLIVSSRTGSGKTVAYGLGLASALLGPHADGEGAGDAPLAAARLLPPPSRPLALVIAPTRELALQVNRELAWLYEDAGAVIAPCVGGMDARSERRQLERGAHIVVGTPGRLVDHLSRGALVLDGLAAVVLDEADEMLDLGFREDLETILAATPATRRTLLFSATLPKAIISLAARFQRNAARIEVAGDVSGHADIEHRASLVWPKAIEHGVVNLLRHAEAPAALVFCNTREAVRHLHATLIERGFAAVILSGELGQHERNQALQALRDGRANVCVATDVAARGIDLPHLGLVIHADLPHDSEVLQHRSGRTGRAGRKGVSVMLVPPSRRRKAERLFAEARIHPAWAPLPGADDIRRQDRERLLGDIGIVADLTDVDRELGAALLERRPAIDLAAALVRILRVRLPEPEEIEEMPPENPRAARAARQDHALRQDQASRQDFAPRRGKPPRPEFEARQENAPHQESALHPGTNRWFELNIGRKDKAEPKGLLRLLVRCGKIDKRHVGGIRIHEHTTQVEISVEVADHFEAQTSHMATEEVRFTPIEPPAPRVRRSFSDMPAEGRPPHGKPPHGKFQHGKKPYKDRKPGNGGAARFDGATPPRGKHRGS
jgi:ATP-dependent RNA helicase DeaD